MSVEWCPKGEMAGDFLTKPNQGALFKRFSDVIICVVDQPDPGPGKPKVSMNKGSKFLFCYLV